MWELYRKSFLNIGKKNAYLNNLKGIVDSSKVHIRNLESQIRIYEDDIKNYEEKVNNLNNEKEELAQATRDAQNAARIYQEQIATIGKSLSWKITKPLRYISWVVRSSRQVRLKDRLLPAGSKRRRKYDEFVQKRAYSKLKKKYSNIIDGKTAKFWTELEVKCIQEKEKRTHDNNYDYWMDANDVTSRELQSQKNVKFEFMPKILNSKEEYLSYSYPLGTDYFSVFNANTSKIGKITNDELRECVINIYITAKFFLDCIATNNSALKFYEKCSDKVYISSYDNILNEGTPKAHKDLEYAELSLMKSKCDNLVPTCQKMVELFKQLDAILQN